MSVSRRALTRVLLRNFTALALAVLPVAAVQAQFVPPRNLDPAGAAIRLDSSFQNDAWLVYAYDIDETGKVVNPQIYSSNGVLEVEQAILRQLSAMQFQPATRNGKPVKVPAEPVVYTWILDLPRKMSPAFEDAYRKAWDLYSQENYDAAFDQAVELKNFPGRNALEEVKFQILAASLASRWKDDAAEMQHLSRVVELQSLAMDNNFKNTYVTQDQFLKILSRILDLQLQRMMLADAGDTLDRMQSLGRGTQVVDEAAARYRAAEADFRSRPEVVVSGELVPLYQGGSGSWKSGLTWSDFSISDVRGKVGGVYLVCGGREQGLHYPTKTRWTVPVGWNDCAVELVGKAGTRLKLHQFAPGN
ncbi:energy transducer TonB [Haliea sp. E17]|uniref:energy transducer TonB n=1 Tax=Haliea sp. E17 TaxID=3401576 RepID=UPI003AAF21FD